MSDKKKLKPLIQWAKTTDPLKTIDSVIEEQKLYSLDDIPEEDEEEEEEEDEIEGKNVNVLFTSMGGMVLDSTNNLHKIFNFWDGHSNFDITKSISEVIEQVPGVEVLTIFTRYRFRIAIGRLFNSVNVKSDIQKRVYEFIKQS